MSSVVWGFFHLSDIFGLTTARLFLCISISFTPIWDIMSNSTTRPLTLSLHQCLALPPMSRPLCCAGHTLLRWHGSEPVEQCPIWQWPSPQTEVTRRSVTTPWLTVTWTTCSVDRPTTWAWSPRTSLVQARRATGLTCKQVRHLSNGYLFWGVVDSESAFLYFPVLNFCLFFLLLPLSPLCTTERDR